jgi:hypothetical protein
MCHCTVLGRQSNCLRPFASLQVDGAANVGVFKDYFNKLVVFFNVLCNNRLARPVFEGRLRTFAVLVELLLLLVGFIRLFVHSPGVSVVYPSTGFKVFLKPS